MPAKTNETQTTKKKNYNPTITAFFDAPKFGLKDESGNGIAGTAFTSTNINAEAFEVVQKHLQIGSKLLLRQSPRLNKNGGKTYYLEILPPLADNTRFQNRGNSDDI